MTQLSGAPIWKDSVQFNNDTTLGHAHARTHTHTMLVPVTGFISYKSKLTRGYSITVSVGKIGGGGVNPIRLDRLLK